MRRERVESTQRELREAGVDGLLVWKDENVRYLTSLRAQLIAGKTMALNGALLLPEGDPVLLCSGGEIDKARAGMPWIAEAHAIPIMEQAELVEASSRTSSCPCCAIGVSIAAALGSTRSVSPSSTHSAVIFPTSK